MDERQVLNLVDVAIKWASDVSEMWVGTQYEKRIDLAQAELIKSVERGDLEKAEEQAKNFTLFLGAVEAEYERQEN